VPKRTLDSHYITALGDETRGVEVTAIMQAVLDPPQRPSPAPPIGHRVLVQRVITLAGKQPPRSRSTTVGLLLREV
jgi:hypothetical protein